MYRIVFYCCALLLLRTFVYSKPYEFNNENSKNSKVEHKNQVILSIKKTELQPEQHEIIQEEPAIYDISTQMAKFILYLIKKYCKNSDKTDYLQYLLTTKGIGSIFKTNADGDIQPNFTYLENNSPQQIIENTNPKSNIREQQGHAINYNFDTAPNYELQIPSITIKPQTKHKEIIHGPEFTTENILVSKQYKTPQNLNKQPSLISVTDKSKIINHVPKINEKYSITKPNIEYNIKHGHPKFHYNYEQPEILEPVYEYASNGNDYGINDYGYNMPDYDDYLAYSTDDAKQNIPKLSQQKIHVVPEIESKVQIKPVTEDHTGKYTVPNYELTTEHDDWYKYIMPENNDKVAEIQFESKHQPKIEANFAQKQPVIKEHKYISPEIPPRTVENKKQPQVHTIDVATPNIKKQPNLDLQEEIVQKIDVNKLKPQVNTASTPEIQMQPDNWLSPKKEMVPKIEGHIEQPQGNNVEFSMPDIQKPDNNWFDFHEEIVPQVEGNIEPQIHTFDLSMPDIQNQPDNNWLNYQQETVPKIEGHMKQPQFSMPDIQKQPDNYWLNFQQEVPKVEEHMEQPQFSMSDIQKQPDNTWLNFEQGVPKVEGNMEQSQFSMPDIQQQPDNNWINLQQEVVPKFEGHVEQPQFSMPDIQKQPDNNWLHFQQEVPKVEGHVEQPQFSMPDIQKQPDNNWINFQQGVPKVEGNIEQPQFSLLDTQQQPDNNWINLQQEVVPKVEGYVEQPQFSMPDIQRQPDNNWINLQQEVVPKIGENIGQPQFPIADIQEQPDNYWINFKHEIPKIGGYIEQPQFSMPDIQQQPDNNWINLQQEVVPKVEGHLEQPQFSIPDTQQQPDNNWLKFPQEVLPKIGENIGQAQFSMPNIQQHPDNNWINLQQEVVPKVEGHTVEFSTPDISEHIDFQEPSIEQSIDFLMPNIKQSEPIIEESEQQPQVHFIDNMQQPEFNQPLLKEHFMDFTIPDIKQQQQQQQEIQVNVNQPHVHFADYVQQPDLHETLVTDYSIPHYELNANAGLIPEINTPIGGQVHFMANKPHFNGQNSFNFQIPEQQQEIIPNMQSRFMSYEPELKQQQIQNYFDYPASRSKEQPNGWYKYSYSMPEYQQRGYKQPDTTYGYGQLQFQPHTKINHINYEHSNIQNPKTHNWLSDTFKVNINNQNGFPDVEWKNYADDLFKNYTIELQNLDNMKPYYKQTVPGIKYIQFIDNINKMTNVLNDWKNNSNFYSRPNIDYVMRIMTELSTDTLKLMDSPEIQINVESKTYDSTTILTPQNNEEESGLRRTFDGAALTKYLEDPESKEEFGTLDILLRNVILAFIELQKSTKTPNIKQSKLMVLHKMKFLMDKYKNLFKHLEWVDDEIKNLTDDEDTFMKPEIIEYINKYLFNENMKILKHLDSENNFNYDINSKLFLTLLNMPYTEKSKIILKQIIERLLQDIVNASEIEPEFENVQFYLGEQKAIDKTAFFKYIMEFVRSPQEFLKHIQIPSTEQSIILENRRINMDEINTEEIETETVMTTTEIIETTTQPPPKEKIEKHNNIFREFLMNTEE